MSQQRRRSRRFPPRTTSQHWTALSLFRASIPALCRRSPTLCSPLFSASSTVVVFHHGCHRPPPERCRQSQWSRYVRGDGGGAVVAVTLIKITRDNNRVRGYHLFGRFLLAHNTSQPSWQRDNVLPFGGQCYVDIAPSCYSPISMPNAAVTTTALQTAVVTVGTHHTTDAPNTRPRALPVH